MKRIFKLTGNRKRELELIGTETIEDVNKLLSSSLDVNYKNWAIYTDTGVGLKRLMDNNVLISDIPEQLYFYPKVERM